MAKRCRGDVNIPYMGMGKQAKNNVILLNVTEPIDACVTIRTNTYTDITGGSARFEAFNKPADQMNCPAPLCNTTGKLFLTQDEYNTDVTVKYENDEATADYMNGVISYYVTVPKEAGIYEVTVTISDRTGSPVVSFTNTIDNSDGSKSGQDILIQHAMDEASTLLPNTENGMVITISADKVNPDTDTSVVVDLGISSISFAQDKAEFEMNNTIGMSCVDEFSFSDEVDATDPTCLGQSLDPDSYDPEITITAQQVTGNYFLLNPLLHKTEEEEVFVPTMISKTIGTVTVNGVQHQGVRLPNYYDDECGFLSAYLPSCDAVEGALVLNTIKNDADPQMDNFKVIVDEATGDHYAIFNDSHAGLETTIVYPVKKTATVHEATTDFVEGRQIRATIPFVWKNGRSGYIVLENAFVTSFPWGWSTSEDTPLEFTIKATKNKNGVYYKFIEIQD